MDIHAVGNKGCMLSTILQPFRQCKDVEDCEERQASNVTPSQVT